jgi:4-carboxymuconolactone decarboxylase
MRNGLLVRAVGAAMMLGAIGNAALAQDGPPRFTQMGMDQLNDVQKRVAERVLKVSSAGLGGPYAMLLRSPVLLERYLGMTDYLRFETSVPKHLNEMAILIQARLWDAQYEWWAHYPIALKAGLSESIANDIRDGKRPANMKPDEDVVYDVCIELLRERHLTDATFERARKILGEQQVIDLVAVAGFYVMVSTVIHAGRIGIPNNGQPPLPVLIKK